MFGYGSWVLRFALDRDFGDGTLIVVEQMLYGNFWERGFRRNWLAFW